MEEHMTIWRRSSYTGANGENCVEVARAGKQIATRDSKNPTGPRLRFNRREWASFLDRIKSDNI